MVRSIEEGKQKLDNVVSDLNVIYDNQRNLADSATRLDDQFAVLTRLAILKINELIERHNVEFEDDPIEPITYEMVNEMFVTFNKFRDRKDYKDHMKMWFMGEDLNILPVPAAGETAPTQPEFGGDYAESQNRN